MLKTRIITALVILPVVFIALFSFPAWAWDVFTLGIALVACWEWSRFCQFSVRGGQIYLACSAAISVAVFFAYLGMMPFAFGALTAGGFTLSVVFWLAVAPLWLANLWRPSGRGRRFINAATGWVVVFPTWLAFLALHDLGPWVLLSFAVVVWIADIAAYFFGKALGRHKLAPSISPGKTVEGAFGGLAGVAAYYFVWRGLIEIPALRGEAWAVELHSHGWWMFAMFLLLGLVSVVGDLFESWMKRGAGMKDSSNLLPGHGGVLDRIDALTSTLPMAGLYLMVMQR
jgi:phosphatidate cytidylyltransferase